MSETQTYTFEVNPMTCGGCTKSVEKALNNLGGVDDITFDLEKKTVVLKTAKSTEEIIAAIGKVGKTAELK
ncbi:heavy metal-associated domain-containing protein [Glomus cerebriforme]|uniref:Heavy metal-associated domain-containing protein n=1 Tax=Glomus cerebriforme TaxID=658196 RepID=A0A397TFJ9_9GLOM|nr:heavy metal-associated domain-containing protein [Glomus cerebriforme]